MKLSNQRGQVLLIVVIFFTSITLTLVFGVISPLLRQLRISKDFQESKQSYYSAEAAADDAFYRKKNNLPVTFPYSLVTGNATATVARTTAGSNEEELLSTASLNALYRTVRYGLTIANGINFNFGVQVGRGGLTMENGSSIAGNVYSDGPITGSGNFIRGTAVSASTTGSIRGIHATSSAYAHAISNSTIDGNAYYQSLSNTTVGGTKYPNSADLPNGTMPISEGLMDQWEAEAAAGGTISSPCPYEIEDDISIGPKKINCDLIIKGNGTLVTLFGALWVKGNITIQNSTEVKAADSLGNRSVPIIARDPANATGKGIIQLQNDAEFDGAAGQSGSYILLISRNTSAESGGGTTAINVQNSVEGDLLLYAPHGRIQIQNNVILREVTGYALTIKNNARVVYESGLAQPIFTDGPGGTWKIRSWRETGN